MNVLVEILDLNRPGLPSLVAPTDRQSLLNSMAQEDIFWAEVLSGRNYPSRSEPTEPIKKKPRPAIIRNPTLAKLAKKYPGLTPKIHGHNLDHKKIQGRNEPQPDPRRHNGQAAAILCCQRALVAITRG